MVLFVLTLLQLTLFFGACCYSYRATACISKLGLPGVDVFGLFIGQSCA